MTNTERPHERGEWWPTPRVQKEIGHSRLQGAGKWVRDRVSRGKIRRTWDPNHKNRPLYWSPDVLQERAASRQGKRTDLEPPPGTPPGTPPTTLHNTESQGPC